LIQSEESVKIFKAVKEWFEKFPVKAYSETEQDGWLRHLVIRTNSKKEALVALVAKDDMFNGAVEFSEFLTKQCPWVKGIFQNVNPKPGNVVLGPEWRHLHGKHFLKETILGLDFRLSPGSFFQVHHAMAEKLYQRVIDFVQPDIKKTVLELYAGVGAMAQLLAKRSRKVWAVEENAEAVADGIESAKWNQIQDIKYIKSKCEDALARGRFQQGPQDKLGAVVLDPPRAGCEQRVLRSVIRLAPEKIVYVSCDPATLARDAKYLATGGYLLRRNTPVDLFPQTAHIESVSLFTRADKTPPAK
jgi:23S rRNA (uracil1939-C5)-methyltransferase